MGKKEWSYILERQFQNELITDIKRRFQGAIVLKNDASYKPGIPDLIILYRDRWAALEVKKSESARRGPNQEYYVDLMNNMAYAAFVHPHNKEEILNEMEQSLRA